MNQELISGITVQDLVTAAVIIAVGLGLAGVVILVGKRIKRKFRHHDENNILARLVDDVEEIVAWLVLLLAFFQALVILPPLMGQRGNFQGVFTAIGVALVVFGLIRLQGHILGWYVNRLDASTGHAKILISMVPTVRRITNIALVSLGILVVLDQLGVTIAPLLAGLGIGGLAVALALQGTLTNFFAGLNILTDGAVRVGDYVELSDGFSGYVDQIGWRTTRIRMLSNNMVIIPNSRLADSITTNYNFPDDPMSLFIKIGVSYFSNLEHVERVTVEVAEEVMGNNTAAVQGYKPSVWYDEFADSNITFWLVLRAHGYLESWTLKHHLMKALFSRYEQEGIEISFPNRNVFFRSNDEEISKAKLRDEHLRNVVALEHHQGETGPLPGELASQGNSEGGPEGVDVPG